MKYYAVILKKKKKRASTQNALLTCEKSRMLKDWYHDCNYILQRERSSAPPWGTHLCTRSKFTLMQIVTT